MPRPPRIELEGGIHHVTVRGNRGQPIFFDDLDRIRFLEHLEISTERYHWTWLSYCLMPNHCHLLLETAERTLGLGMQRLNGQYAQAFNRRHGLSGHLFQGRFHSRLVTTDEYLAQVFRYIARNPRKAGLCDDPREWRWSSHGLFLAGAPSVARSSARVDDLLAAWGGRPSTRYAGLFDGFGPADDDSLDDDGSPRERRASLPDQLQGATSRADWIRAAHKKGFSVADIATRFGVHRTTVARWLHETEDPAERD